MSRHDDRNLMVDTRRMVLDSGGPTASSFTIWNGVCSI